MTKARPQILSLNGGEVDEETIARSDIDSYANKAQLMVNAVPAIKGGMFRAPGTRFIGRTLRGGGEDMFAVARPWRFSRPQAFTAEISNGRMRLVFGVGYIQTGAGEATFDAGGWTDDSSGGGGSAETPPTWPAQPGPLSPPPTGIDPVVTQAEEETRLHGGEQEN